MRVEVECISPLQGPVTEAILITSYAGISMSAGVSGQVHRLAGQKLSELCREIGPIEMGDAVVTPGFSSPFKWIVHARPANNLAVAGPWSMLEQTVIKAIKTAGLAGIQSVTMAAFGTGSAQIQPKAAAQFTIRALVELGAVETGVKLVRICIANPTTFDYYLRAARERNLVKTPSVLSRLNFYSK